MRAGFPRRFFLRGRTETIHPGSHWSVDWVHAMDDPAVDKERRRTLLKNAVKHQNQFRLNATIGKGCDRHLLGLLMASAELGLGRPKIFTDSVLLRFPANPDWIIQTSFITYR